MTYWARVVLLIITALSWMASAEEVDLGGDLLPDPTSDVLAALNLPPGSGLMMVTPPWHTKRNTLKAKFRQTFLKLEVYGTVVTAEYLKNGSFTGNWTGVVSRKTAPPSLLPKISGREAAVAVAKAFRLCPSVLSKARNIQTPLVLLPDGALDSMVLTYFARFLLDLSEGRDPISPHGFVDAQKRTVILFWNGLAYQNALVPLRAVGGNAGRAGLQSFEITALRQSTTTCVYSNRKVEVQNLRNGTTGPFSPSQFPCDQAANLNYDSVNGGYSPLNDVARNCEIVVNMYSSYLAIPSPTGTLPVRARVHYGTLYDNAFWDGTYLNIGDGSSIIYPLSTLDIVGHELGHGFTGIYSSLQHIGQSGAVNEAFSDISGQAAVFFSTGKNSFVVGDNITKADSRGIRNMCNPTVDGKSIDDALKYQMNLDIHFSCGIYNKAFCLLARTPGWDTAIAFTLMAYANAVYWGQTTNFTEGLCSLKMAAADLQYNVNDVVRAFAAVNVVCPR